MKASTAELQVPEHVSVDDLRARVTLQFGLHEEPERSIQRTYLDSFDWRLHAGGVVVQHLSDSRHGELIWCKLKSGAETHRLVVEQVPRFAADLPAGPFRDALARRLEMRALLPLVRIESRLSPWRVLGDEDKTVVRLELEQGRYLSPDGARSGDLGVRLHLRGVRGYDREFKRVRAMLEELLQPVSEGLYQVALRTLGRSPGDYSSKLAYRLDPEERADQAAKAIHLGLLRTLEANMDGARADLDSEFLHDLRVATRRTRSALSQIKGVFPERTVEHFKEAFAWIQRITGPTRDMDVYLLALDGYKADLPVQLRDDLEPLRDFLQAHHRSEQQLLAKELASPEFRAVLEEWRGFLEAPAPEHPSATHAARLIKAVADERIWKMYRRVWKEGRGITEASPPEFMHELRKSCKKLRYLIEFFESLYPRQMTGALVKILKGLLDNLGEFQDLEVQAHALQHFADQMTEEGRVAPATLLAMGALIGCLYVRQRAARQQFARIFAAFDTAEHNRMFRAMVRTGAIRGEAA
jgi:CHAD domain-containing protein